MSEVILGNNDAEMGVIGSMSMDRTVIPQVAAYLDDGDAFVSKDLRAMYVTMLSLYEEHLPIDMVVLIHEMKQHAGDYDTLRLEELAIDCHMNVASAVNGPDYARIVADAFRRRQLYDVGKRMQELAKDNDEQYQSNAVATFQGFLASGYSTDSVVSGHAMLDCLLSESSEPLPTHNNKIDSEVGGLMRQQLTVIAARPTVGKTSLALSMAHAMSSTARILFVSLEQGSHDLSCRLLSLSTSRPANKYAMGAVAKESLKKDIAEYRANHSADELFFTVKSMTAELLTRVVQSADRPYDVVFIDYLQLLHPRRRKGENREQEVTRLIDMLKRLAVDCRCAVVALSQLNRGVEQRGLDNRPRLSDLRESGSIEQASDVVILLHRTAKDKGNDDAVDFIPEGSVIAKIAKNRNGPQSSWSPMSFDRERMMFQ